MRQAEEAFRADCLTLEMIQVQRDEWDRRVRRWERMWLEQGSFGRNGTSALRPSALNATLLDGGAGAEERVQLAAKIRNVCGMLQKRGFHVLDGWDRLTAAGLPAPSPIRRPAEECLFPPRSRGCGGLHPNHRRRLRRLRKLSRSFFGHLSVPPSLLLRRAAGEARRHGVAR